MHICATEYTILASLFPVWSHPLCFVYAAAAAALPVYFLIEEGSRIFWNPVPQPISPDFSCSFLLLLRNLAAAPCHTDGVHTAYTWPAIHGRCGRCGRWFIFIYINCFIRLFVCGMRSRAVYGTHCIAISMIMYTNRKIACIFAIQLFSGQYHRLIDCWCSVARVSRGTRTTFLLTCVDSKFLHCLLLVLLLWQIKSYAICLLACTRPCDRAWEWRMKFSYSCTEMKQKRSTKKKMRSKKKNGSRSCYLDISPPSNVNMVLWANVFASLIWVPQMSAFIVWKTTLIYA